MKTSSSVFVTFLLASLSLPTSSSATNFLCPDPQITASAEAARVKSAIFWTGKPLPGDWYDPCPIQVVAADHSGGGMTQFRFENGEVHGWSMTIEGPRAALLQDVIPHEVDHAVRASLVRHPIERWLDEGCASLFESAEVRQKLRTAAMEADSNLIQSNWLNSFKYPADPTQIQSLYAVGFSLVEYLLSLKDASALLEFQKRNGPVDKRLNEIYGISVAKLRTDWNAWKVTSIQAQTALKCECVNRTKPLLVIWTAKWCGACQVFWESWNKDSKFRQSIEEHYHVHILDYDLHQALAINHRIQNLPTFQTQSHRVIGFEDRESLLNQLGLSEPGSHPRIPTELGNETTSNEIATIPPAEEILESETVPTENVQSEVETDEQSVAPSVPNESKSWFEKISNALPVGLTVLQWTGILGGTAATGGLAGFAIAMLPKLISLRKRKQHQSVPEPDLADEGRESPPHYPFPRELDEASQLLELRQSEGRVAVLDALRGMFLEDEIEKMKSTKDRVGTTILDELMSAVDQRVDQVAPLSTQIK